MDEEKKSNKHKEVLLDCISRQFNILFDLMSTVYGDKENLRQRKSEDVQVFMELRDGFLSNFGRHFVNDPDEIEDVIAMEMWHFEIPEPIECPDEKEAEWQDLDEVMKLRYVLLAREALTCMKRMGVHV